MEVEYFLRNYVDGRSEFKIPTKDTYNFKRTPKNEFTIGADGSVSNGDCLRPHLYADGSRANPPIFILDCKQPAEFVIRVTKSVGDRTKKLRIYMDERAADAKGASKKRSGWWRGIWDGRYVYRPGQGGWLYDHQTDPYEMENLIDSPEHEEVRRRLGRMMVDFAERTADPVLAELKEMLGRV
jgi:hypothetical protein